MFSYPYPTIKDPAGAGSYGPSRCGLVLFGSVVAPAFFRRYLLLSFHLSHDLANEIVLFFLDAVAHGEAHELHHGGAGFLEKFFDRRVRIFDKWLTDQGN